MKDDTNIYPPFKHSDMRPLYYVEFDRGEKAGNFTLFKRQFLRSVEELAKIKEEHPDSYLIIEMGNESHPWNLFTAQYGPDGCVPDKAWVRWMVEALNTHVYQTDDLIQAKFLRMLKKD